MIKYLISNINSNLRIIDPIHALIILGENVNHDDDLALIVYENALEMSSNNVLNLSYRGLISQHASVLKNLGSIHYRRKENDKAIECFEKILKIYPRDSEVLYQMGYCYHEKSQHDKAIKCFKKIFKIDSENLYIKFLVT